MLLSQYVYLLFGLIFCLSTAAGQQLISSAGNATEVAAFGSMAYSVGEPVITTLAAGNYKFTQGFHQPNGMKIDTLSVAIHISAPSCNTSSDGSIFLEISGCLSPYTIIWNDGDSAIQREHLPAGQYIVTVSGLTGCSITDTIVLTPQFDGPCDILIYHGFSPNGDGVNDVWIIENINLYQPNRVEIYNRWGTMVWATDNYDNRNIVWKGEDNHTGKLLPNATYFYLVKLNTGILKGWVEITR